MRAYDVSTIKRLPTGQKASQRRPGLDPRHRQTNPNIDLVGASNGPKRDHVISATVEEHVLALGLQKDDVVALHAHAVNAEQHLVDFVDHLAAISKPTKSDSLTLNSHNFSPKFLATPPSATSYNRQTPLHNHQHSCTIVSTVAQSLTPLHKHQHHCTITSAVVQSSTM